MSPATHSARSDDAFPEPNRTDPQLTVRAIGTGVLLGALLTPCNIYSGLKIGWAFNMSIAAALLSYALWRTLETTGGTRPWGMLENNINQTAASASASIISSGLVAPIPALTILTGDALPWLLLAVWVFSVSAVGVVMALGFRQHMLLRERLSFPAGVATAETVREIYGKGGEAIARIKVLATGGLAAGGLKLVNELVVPIPKVGLPISFKATGALAASVPTVWLKNLGFALDPSLLMVGFGAIIGLRAGASLLLGAVLAWGLLGPWALAEGWAEPGTLGPDRVWFEPMVEWLLWPGITLMVAASLTSVLGSWPRAVSMARSLAGSRARGDRSRPPSTDVPRGWYGAALVAALLLAVVTQVSLFGISVWAATLAAVLTFLLAIVAARVSGETGITPIGALGKVTQLTFGFLVPGHAASNLMSANVTGGAAAQCADLLHDLKTGLLLGALPRAQAVAQLFGVLTGSLVGSAVYVVLVPDPGTMLLTKEWPAPAVATWLAVAEVFQQGMGAMPPKAIVAMALAGVIGIVLALLAKWLPERGGRWVPSPTAMGLAFVIPAWNSLSLFLGALAGYVLLTLARTWTERFLLALAAGFVAGESLAGIAVILFQVLTSAAAG